MALALALVEREYAACTRAAAQRQHPGQGVVAQIGIAVQRLSAREHAVGDHAFDVSDGQTVVLERVHVGRIIGEINRRANIEMPREYAIQPRHDFFEGQRSAQLARECVQQLGFSRAMPSLARGVAQGVGQMTDQ